MAYKEEARKVSLRINYENGLDDKGEMRTRYKTIKDVRADLSADVLGQTAKMIAGFMKDKLVSTSKIVEYDLVEGEQL